MFGLDSATIVASGQLQPGQMIALDTETGERLDHHQIHGAAWSTRSQAELGDVHEVNRAEIIVPEGFDFTTQIDDQVGAMLDDRGWTLEHLLQGVGWDFERAVFVKDMAKLKKEPLGSMGYDRVLTIFCQHHPTLFKYLQQTFAEVTNPPIDPYREGGAMSLTTYIGRPGGFRHRNRSRIRSGESEVRNPSPRVAGAGRWSWRRPVISDAIIEEIRRNEVLGYQLIDTTFPLSGGEEALREALHRIRSEAERAVHAGYAVLCLSDKEACNRGIDPIPSLLALGAVHTYLCRQGLRDRCSLDRPGVGDVQEGHDICCLVAFGADAVHPYLMLRLIKDGLTFKDAETKQEVTVSAHECLENLFAALEDSIKKIIAKMGITTIEGYRGAQLFEAVGFGPELMEWLGDFPSADRRARAQGTGRGRGLAGEDGRGHVRQEQADGQEHGLPGLQREGPDGPARRGQGSPPGAGAGRRRAGVHGPAAGGGRRGPAARRREVAEVHGHGEHPAADRVARPVQHQAHGEAGGRRRTCSRPST